MSHVKVFFLELLILSIILYYKNMNIHVSSLFIYAMGFIINKNICWHNNGNISLVQDECILR